MNQAAASTFGKDETGVELRAPVGRMRCDPGWSFASDPTKLDNYRIWLIWAGEGELVAPGGERIALLPGVTVVMRPDGVYRAAHNSANPLGVTFLNYAYRAEAPLPPVWCWTSDFLFIDAVTRKIVQLHAAELAGLADNGRRTAMLLRAVLDELHGAALQLVPGDVPSSRLDRDVIELANKVLEMPAEHDDISELAGAVFRSRSHFTRTFRRIYGVSPISFVKSTKLLKARNLLQTTSMSIGEICSILGYSTTQYFSRQYRSYFATTPGEDRRRAQHEAQKSQEETI
ncbi:MAG TPA: AraC family transcriptional regulator [Devosia sp.]|uniref:helix-turn-helix domain-containing protein n=1 Tax=Devosia sp. TaxID=1871048 RepID=UPI002DDD1093|nr:AraC family transcriptional regulator [Devosia sp.]HEV2517119.1 AraC family transcriptional regulator [Devosia sp.]